jgi:hypothetical protein
VLRLTGPSRNQVKLALAAFEHLLNLASSNARQVGAGQYTGRAVRTACMARNTVLQHTSGWVAQQNMVACSYSLSDKPLTARLLLGCVEHI